MSSNGGGIAIMCIYIYVDMKIDDKSIEMALKIWFSAHV